MSIRDKRTPEFPDQSDLGYIKLEGDFEFFLSPILDNPQATDQDEIPGTSGKFGLEPSNPIPIHGVPNAKIYLESLLLENGEIVDFERIGSVVHLMINLPIDEYQLYDYSGKKISKLYISPYHKRCSVKIPEGFISLDSYL